LTSDNFIQKTQKAEFKLVEAEELISETLVYKPESDSFASCPAGGADGQSVAASASGETSVLRTQALSLHFSTPENNQALSLHYADHPYRFPDDTFWERRGRQLFNAIYFSIAIVALYFVAATSDFLMFPAVALLLLLAILALQSAIYAVFHKTMLGSSTALSLKTQKNLRRTALVTPAVILLVAASNGAGQMMDSSLHLTEQKDLFTYGMDSLEIRQSAARSIESIAAIAPLNSALTSHLYEDAKASSLHPQALMLADRMTFFRPFDGRWKIRRLSALAFLPGREQEFESLSREYQKTFATDGFLWNTLADIAVAKKDWPLALQMANAHVKIHDKESLSYEQRAAIEKELGMAQEAEDDLAAANSVSSSP